MLSYILTGNAIISELVICPILNFYQNSFNPAPSPSRKTRRYFDFRQHDFSPKMFRSQIYKSNKSAKKPYYVRYSRFCLVSVFL